jgi:catechol 2,3-dioxygenase-like lactoylglutathione lyase family enzyme
VRVDDSADRVVIARSDDDGPHLAFERSESIPADYPDPDHPAMLHLDLYFDDGRAATELAQSLGARPRQRPGTPPGSPPSVFADPAGHPFCIMSPHRS